MRDRREEYRLALEAFRQSQAAYQRCLADCRERVRIKREWVRETQRRVKEAEEALASRKPVHGV